MQLLMRSLSAWECSSRRRANFLIEYLHYFFEKASFWFIYAYFT